MSGVVESAGAAEAVAPGPASPWPRDADCLTIKGNGTAARRGAPLVAAASSRACGGRAIARLAAQIGHGPTIEPMEATTRRIAAIIFDSADDIASAT